MTKSQATELAKVINYFANEYQNKVWDAKASNYFENEWKVEVRLNNSAFQHELNALMMIVNNNVTSAVYQEVDDNKEIYWKIW